MNREALGTVSLDALEPFDPLPGRKSVGGSLFSAMTECGLIDASNLDYWARLLGQRVRHTNGT